MPLFAKELTTVLDSIELVQAKLKVLKRDPETNLHEIELEGEHLSLLVDEIHDLGIQDWKSMLKIYQDMWAENDD